MASSSPDKQTFVRRQGEDIVCGACGADELVLDPIAGVRGKGPFICGACAVKNLQHDDVCPFCGATGVVESSKPVPHAPGDSFTKTVWMSMGNCVAESCGKSWSVR